MVGVNWKITFWGAICYLSIASLSISAYLHEWGLCFLSFINVLLFEFLFIDSINESLLVDKQMIFGTLVYLLPKKYIVRRVERLKGG